MYMYVTASEQYHYRHDLQEINPTNKSSIRYNLYLSITYIVGIISMLELYHGGAWVMVYIVLYL